MPTVGSLDRRITIERAVSTPDDRFNEPILSWSTLAEVWTKVTRQPGREFLNGEQRTSEQRVVFTIRYRDVVATDRLVFEGDRFEIVDVREVNRREWLELHAFRSDADDGGSP